MPSTVVLWLRVKANGLFACKARILTSLKTEPLTVSLFWCVKNKVPSEAQPVVVLNS